jgi:molybdopterin molybdotransferase
MISIDEARSLIRAETHRKGSIQLPIECAIGLTLAENLISDVDSPPHDKSLVDGYALIAADVQGPETELAVIEEITAGSLPQRSVETGTAARIMTGSVLPSGADAVVMHEDTSQVARPNQQNVRIHQRSVDAGQHVMTRGASIRRGDTVFSRNHRVRALDIGLLSEIGQAEVSVTQPPRVAILATGNELVPPSQTPPTGNIRNSNGPLLAALSRGTGAEVVDLGICPDSATSLRQQIRRNLEMDVLILSGGVSAGVLDLVPRICDELGVRQVFHKVYLKPGKPLWFGVSDHPSHQTLVFGLPGNPLGSLVCFELFVRPTLEMLAGQEYQDGGVVRAQLASEYRCYADRPSYVPATARSSSDGRSFAAQPLTYHGSADQRSLAAANCLISLPVGESSFQPGDWIDILLLETQSCFQPYLHSAAREAS